MVERSPAGTTRSENISQLKALVIGERLATLHELETVYSFPDLLDLAEIVMVQRNNEAAANKEAARR